MNIIIGLACGLGLFLLLCLTAWIGYKIGRMQKPKELTIQEKEKEIIRLNNEGMQNIMNYDINKAMERRVKNE